jgi:hypothetical protein
MLINTHTFVDILLMSYFERIELSFKTLFHRMVRRYLIQFSVLVILFSALCGKLLTSWKFSSLRMTEPLPAIERSLVLWWALFLLAESYNT